MLSDEDIELFASQIVMPEIGASGQARLASATAVVFGQNGGAREARRYLKAAGIRVQEGWDPDEPIDCLIVANLDSLTPADRERAATISAPVVWYRITGRSITTGSAASMPALSLASTESRDNQVADAPTTIAECMAGADAAATAVGLILGWTSPGDTAVEIILP